MSRKVFQQLVAEAVARRALNWSDNGDGHHDCGHVALTACHSTHPTDLYLVGKVPDSRLVLRLGAPGAEAKAARQVWWTMGERSMPISGGILCV